MSYHLEKRSNTKPVLHIIHEVQHKSIEVPTKMFVSIFVKYKF